ncbi:MAG: cytochrome c3 family protein [Desulfatitalea sp.]|nr:cytochrome c family protein [Desulfatitalea sp.]NNJ99208.1 cytochrome c3 family protein [Desulfatitalea sp.]
MRVLSGFLAAALISLTTVMVPPSSSLAQEDMPTVDNRAFVRPVRPPALFDHDVHNEKAGVDDCAVCHHVYANGNLQPEDTSEDAPCAACHDPAGKDNPFSLRRAFHLRCKGCHLDRKAGPVMCAACHPAT